MPSVDILEAKTHLFRLVDDLASGTQRDIIITRNGKPVARLVPAQQRIVRLGVLKGKFQISADLDVDNAEIAAEFDASRA